MGYLRKKFIKSEKKRFIIGVVIDIILIASFIYMGNNCKQEWMAGYEFCKEQYNYNYQWFNFTVEPETNTSIVIDKNITEIPRR